MLKNIPKSLADLMGTADSGIGQLASAARLRADLSDYLRNRLDASLCGGFVHCNVRDDTVLIITATSPEWAARLRFESQQFADLCRERGLDIQSVKVRVGT